MCPTFDRADYTLAPTQQHELDHADRTDHTTDQVAIYPEGAGGYDRS